MVASDEQLPTIFEKATVSSTPGPPHGTLPIFSIHLGLDISFLVDSSRASLPCSGKAGEEDNWEEQAHRSF